ncbi:SDR family oxidoreductase [Mycobacterium sp. UM_CSW]|uniref:SDR family oxidoreductase n=1 Tax=Mycobacterium sp. UM_CSW TaxID=1370119 RepID=UPI0004266268|nr:SDR family oxidoreductase [Mycobacterium sp. UM_CSW]
MRGVTVITGGGGGMGLAAAKIVGRDRAVVISDVNRDRLDAAVTELEQSGIECKGFVCDITDRKSVAELVDTSSAFGTVVSVIHTAGISPSMGAGARIMRINAIGTVNVNEGFRRIAGEGFVLVNVASQAAHMLPRMLFPTKWFQYATHNEDAFMARMVFLCNLAPKNLRSDVAYCLSKSFVVWYCASQAATFGHQGGRIVSISPGPIDNEMGRLEERGSASIVRYAALSRFGKQDEIAELLAFCASEKAGYLTGVDILCDGGAITSMTMKDKAAVTRYR